MSIAPVKTEARELLYRAKDRIRRAEVLLSQGDDNERVHAAGLLVLFRRQQAELESRVSELDRCPDDLAHTVVERIREEWLVFKQEFERWVEER